MHNLNQVISTDIDKFYLMSIDPDKDGWLNQYGFKNVKQVKDSVRQLPEILNLFNRFLNENHILNNEYIVVYSNFMLMTNYRLFIVDSNGAFSIALPNIINYQSNNGQVIEITYNKNGQQKKYYVNEWIREDLANNALQRHIDSTDSLSDIEKDVLENNKPQINQKYSYTPNETYVTEKPKRVLNYGALSKLVLIIAFVVGFIYMFAGVDDSTNSSDSYTTNKYCDKHNVTYSQNNAYGGCPKCSNEKFAKESADAMEKKINGR